MDNAFFIVGSPSGWKSSQRLAYKELLLEAGMKKLKVRPESRAAFLSARDSGELGDAFMSLSKSVLVIDVGSSTTDFTLVKDYEEEPLDLGRQLGGSLIDESIFEFAQKNQNDSDIAEKVLSSEKLTNECKLACRRVKEEWFSSADVELSRALSVEMSVRLSRGKHFEIEIGENEMKEILSQPVFNGLCWREAFYSELLNCKKVIEEDKNQNTPLPNLIFLTGGASRMRFLRQACADVFPGVRVRVGTEPQLTIAKGLAIIGRTDFKIDAFRKEVARFIESTTLRELIRDEVPLLCEALSERLLEKVSKISKDKFNEWMTGDVSTIENVEKAIRTETERFLKCSGEVYFRSDVDEWLEAVSQKIEDKTYPICDRYKIPRTALSIGEASANLPQGVGKSELGEIIGYSISSMVSIATMITAWLLVCAVLIAAPFGAWLTVVSIATAGVAGGTSLLTERESIIQMAKGMDVPVKLRRLLFFDSSLQKQIESSKDPVKQQILAHFENDLLSEEKFRQVLMPIQEELNRSADRAALIIKCSA